MNKKVFKILSIDGGGIKGLYSSRILEHFESKFNVSISDYFDMLCGTSTGGLIALALSLKIPVSDISNLYAEKGEKIFPQNLQKWRRYNQILGSGKYSDIPLKEELNIIFGDKTLNDSNNLLCIPSYCITNAKPWIFKFDHKEGDLSRDNDTKYVDVALSTSAAPTFLPIAEIENYDNKQFIDGGVWANNPTLVGVLEALTYFVGENKEFDSIEVLSMSSLNPTEGKSIQSNRYKSFKDWGDELFETSMVGQSHFTNYFMSKIGDITTVPIKHFRIPSADISSEQSEKIKLDITTKESIKLISGMGNAMGEVFKKDSEIKNFFKNKKHYKTN